MATDRAEEIARELRDNQCGQDPCSSDKDCICLSRIVAALRSYGDEKLEEAGHAQLISCVLPTNREQGLRFNTRSVPSRLAHPHRRRP